MQPVAEDQWSVLAWLWQSFRSDLAPIVGALPYSDGRYNASGLPTGPDPGVAAYMALDFHPNTAGLAPVGFAVVEGLGRPASLRAALWVAPVARRRGAGMELALNVIARHRSLWQIPFQHDNTSAGAFWRVVADRAFGPNTWTEERRKVRHKPHAPADHWIISATE